MSNRRRSTRSQGSVGGLRVGDVRGHRFHLGVALCRYVDGVGLSRAWAGVHLQAWRMNPARASEVDWAVLPSSIVARGVFEVQDGNAPARTRGASSSAAPDWRTTLPLATWKALQVCADLWLDGVMRESAAKVVVLRGRHATKACTERWGNRRRSRWPHPCFVGGTEPVGLGAALSQHARPGSSKSMSDPQGLLGLRASLEDEMAAAPAR